MYEIFLNAGKMLISKDARETGSSLLELIRRSPEWQRDICTITLRTEPSNREQTVLIRELCVGKLTDLAYSKKILNSFQTSYFELVENALEHGCLNSKKAKIEIQVDITKAYVALIVLNSKGVVFDPHHELTKFRIALQNDPTLPRGRGLLSVKTMADEFLSIEDGAGIKLVFYRDSVEIEVYRFDGLVIFRLVSGIFNPALPSRIENLANRHVDEDIVMDLSLWENEPTSMSMVCRIVFSLKLSRGKSSKTVLILPPDPDRGAVSMEGIDYTYSWKETLQYLDRPELQEKISNIIPKRKTVTVSNLLLSQYSHKNI